MRYLQHCCTCSTVLHVSTQEKSLNVRATKKELELWKEAAWIRKVSLSEWVRKVLTATAEQTKNGQ
jgi:predicted HicB family RNase H-like nuclease